MATLTFDLCQLTPTEIAIDVVGTSVSGGRSMAGTTQTVDYSGGGFVTATYGGINILTRAQHRYWSQLAGILNGGSTRIFVPLWTDPLLDEAVDYSTNADVTADAALHSAEIAVASPGYAILPGMWFSINHGGALDHRAYKITDKAAGVLTIVPPLRAAVTAATGILRFNRPRCSMCLPPDQSMPWSWQAPGLLGSGVISFMEHF